MNPTRIEEETPKRRACQEWIVLLFFTSPSRTSSQLLAIPRVNSESPVHMDVGRITPADPQIRLGLQDDPPQLCQLLMELRRCEVLPQGRHIERDSKDVDREGRHGRVIEDLDDRLRVQPAAVLLHDLVEEDVELMVLAGVAAADCYRPAISFADPGVRVE